MRCRDVYFNKNLSEAVPEKETEFKKSKISLCNVPKLNTFLVSPASRPSSGSSPSTSSTSPLASGSCRDAADDRQQATPRNVSDCN